MAKLKDVFGAATSVVKNPDKVVTGGSRPSSNRPSGSSSRPSGGSASRPSGSSSGSSGNVTGGYNPNLTSKPGGGRNPDSYAAPTSQKQNQATLPALNQYGYRDIDYSAEISKTSDPVRRQQLIQERENKIKYKYGGAEPNMTGSNQKFSDSYGGRPSRGGTSFDNNFAQNQFEVGRNYADDAIRHAAAGDWGAVERDLIQRQAKIDAQGGNNRGLTNEQLLQQLKNQYGQTYGQMSQRDQDRLTLISGGKIPFTGAYGVQGNIELNGGWQQGIDYLAQAQQYAQAGDLDAAYDALMRRGFKMYDTGSRGNGISQDQAYALIDRIWRSSPRAQETYQREMQKNAQWLEESGARAGNPSNAYKTLLKGGYWITYDGRGNPVIADRVSNNVDKRGQQPSYTPEQIEYLAKYYTGQAGDYSQAYIPAHNIYVTQTGNGRLLDQYGNYASGEAPTMTNSKGYTGSLYPDGANQNQDRTQFQPILDRINKGEQFGALGPNGLQQPGGGADVPLAPLPGGSVISGGSGGVIGAGSSGNINFKPGVSDAYDPGNMGDYLDQWYESAQQQQQNAIDFGTNQAILELLRNQQDSEAKFQAQRDQIAIDEAKAKDNQALYSESRGDKGGIGAAQYDAIMNTAAQNRLQVNSAQTKLATDTARQIADLRAQGEFEKADALLQLSQKYLSQLMSLEQWAAEYNLSVAQFNASLQQWQAEFDLSVAELLGSYNGRPTLGAQQFEYNKKKYEEEQATLQDQKLANAGEVLLAAGVLPSASQLAAMGMTVEQAQAYITAQKVAAAAKKKGIGSSSSGGSGKSPIAAALGTDAWYAGIRDAAAKRGQSVSDYLNQNYKSLGLTVGQASTYAEKYEDWAAEYSNWSGAGKDLPSYDVIKPNSEAGKYGPNYNQVLGMVQIMTTRDNAPQEEVERYLLEQMDAGRINGAGVATILQALGIERG